ncbi:MAG: hypothetical protein AAGG09_00635 [Pseudomonadota bacterium]
MAERDTDSPMHREPITYADAQPDLPQSPFARRLAELRISRLFDREAANDDVDLRSNRRESRPDQARAAPQSVVSSVVHNRPHPAARPRSDIADEVDAEAFEARWEAARLEAARNALFPPKQGDRTMTDDYDQAAAARDATNRPAETVREGQLKAAIWRNENENGAYHSVTLARTYKDRDGNLQDTSNFRPKDMLGLSELARRAHHQAQDLDRELFKEQRREQQTQDRPRGQSR